MATKKKTSNKKQAPEKVKAFKVVHQDLEKNTNTLGGIRVSEYGQELYFGYWDSEEDCWVKATKVTFDDGAEMDISEGYLKVYYATADNEALDQVVECAQKDMERNEEWAK